MFLVVSGAGGGGFTRGHFIVRVISGGAVWLFANKTEAISEAMASFDRGYVQRVDIHSIWVTRGAGVWRTRVLISMGWWRDIPMVHEGNLSSDFFLEVEMGGFLVPEGKGGGYGIHGLDAVHNPGGEPGGEVRDQGGGIFCFIIFSTDDIQLECIDVFLELFSSVDASGR